LRDGGRLSHDARMRNIMLVASVVFGLGACGKDAGDKALAKMEDFKNQICACKDKECLEKVQKDMTEWMESMSKEMSDKKPTKAQEEKGEKIFKELEECTTKLMGGE
jgi:hypothetical protein